MLIVAALTRVAFIYGSPYPLIPIVLTLPIIVWWAFDAALRTTVWFRWTRKGLRGLLVYSESPNWQHYIESEWRPKLGPSFAVLNWSNRASWKTNLKTMVFERYCGRDRNFNPAIVLFRGFRRPLVFRFFEAFRLAKRGRTRALEVLERELFKELGMTYSKCTYTEIQNVNVASR